ncbi:hypothetical protein FKM82_014565 [Ascaphus truei]
MVNITKVNKNINLQKIVRFVSAGFPHRICILHSVLPGLGTLPLVPCSTRLLALCFSCHLVKCLPGAIWKGQTCHTRTDC